MPEVLQQYQNRYLHLLVDEFQDTNVVQYTLARLLAGKYRPGHITVRTTLRGKRFVDRFYEVAFLHARCLSLLGQFVQTFNGTCQAALFAVGRYTFANENASAS